MWLVNMVRSECFMDRLDTLFFNLNKTIRITFFQESLFSPHTMKHNNDWELVVINRS